MKVLRFKKEPMTVTPPHTHSHNIIFYINAVYEKCASVFVCVYVCEQKKIYEDSLWLGSCKRVDNNNNGSNTKNQKAEPPASQPQPHRKKCKSGLQRRYIFVHKQQALMMNIYNITNKWWLVIVALLRRLIAMQRFCSIFITNNNNFMCALRIASYLFAGVFVILKQQYTLQDEWPPAQIHTVFLLYTLRSSHISSMCCS